MSKPTARHQIRIADERQLIRPTQLDKGSEIARVSLWRGTSDSERLMRAGITLAELLRKDDGPPLKSLTRARRHEDLEVIYPDWRGTVEWRDNNGVAIRKTGQPPEHAWEKYINTDPAALPDVAPVLVFHHFADLGLAALQDGRWEFAATLDLSRKITS